MKRVLTLLAAVSMAASAFGQAYEFRYNGAADVIFSYPPRGSGGRAFVHDANNVLTINYEGDFTNGVKIGNSFWVTNNGRTGIGTSNPQEKLAVKGKILAEEIKVTTASADWPDYVFKSNYILSSLRETEKYIQKNGHLPDVPTAEEVESDGVSLGHMNKILLKKIEEMTLHLIEKDKVINRIMERLEKLESTK